MCKVTRLKATILQNVEALAGPLALPCLQPDCTLTRHLLTRTAATCCSQLGFREVMSPVPGDTCPRADNTVKVVNRMRAERRGSELQQCQ